MQSGVVPGDTYHSGGDSTVQFSVVIQAQTRLECARGVACSGCLAARSLRLLPMRTDADGARSYVADERCE